MRLSPSCRGKTGLKRKGTAKRLLTFSLPKKEINRRRFTSFSLMNRLSGSRLCEGAFDAALCISVCLENCRVHRFIGILDDKQVQVGIIIWSTAMTSAAKKVCPSSLCHTYADCAAGHYHAADFSLC